VLPSLDAAMMLEALRAGVDECVAEPFTQDDVQAAIDRVAAQRPEAEKGEVFAIIGAKGGVGATTLAVNVVAMLAALSKETALLMDLHLTYGDAGVFLGVEPRFSVADAFENLHRLDAAVLKGLVTPTKMGVHLLASSDRPVVTGGDATSVRTLIDFASTQYSSVVLDVPRSDAVVLDALDQAARIVVVANQEVATVRAAARVSSALQQRYGRDRVQIVMTRYDESADIGQRDVERVFGSPVKHLFPNNYSIAVMSQNKGRPLVLDNHTKLARSMTLFARALAGLPEQVEGGRGGGWFRGKK
jgi:pilus assembly protein CpaE